MLDKVDSSIVNLFNIYLSAKLMNYTFYSTHTKLLNIISVSMDTQLGNTIHISRYRGDGRVTTTIIIDNKSVSK